MNAAEYQRIEANLSLLRQALAKPALEALNDYIALLERTRAEVRIRLTGSDYIRDPVYRDITGRIEFAQCILSARREANQVTR